MLETNSPNGFKSLGISPSLLTMIGKLGITTPSPIQEAAIPVALTGRDIIGIAQTGTGKTLAFGLPMAKRLQDGGFGLVIAPTRELAIQIEDTFHKLQIKTALLIGGAPISQQLRQLRAKPTVIIATPGRLIDHLSSRSVNLSQTAIVVLDEADRMLDMGFAPAIKRILDSTPNNRQTMMFSATMPKEIAQLADTYLRNPKEIEVTPPGTPVERIQQEVMLMSKESKPDNLYALLKKHPGSILVFARTRHGARKIAKSIRAEGHTACEIHSDRTLAQRKDALHGFKIGKYRILVATDIAARGIDVKEISLVINYDVPEKPEDYLHRIGRTGRAGAEGQAITFATPDQHKDIRDIERLLRSSIPGSPKVAAQALKPRVDAKSTPARSGRKTWNKPRPERKFAQAKK